jgi:Glu-tRNA(Gln) amidotransferase subunit E-like FAD-binding protein
MASPRPYNSHVNLREILLSTHSRIVNGNGGRIWLLRIPGAGGRFGRRQPGYLDLRPYCLQVKRNLHTGGFFTTDELPGYGLTRADLSMIRFAAAATHDDLVVCFAYDKRLAERAAQMVLPYLTQWQTAGRSMIQDGSAPPNLDAQP